MAGKVIDFLEQLQQDHAAIAADVGELAALYQKKLWHQLTVRLDECFAKPEFNRGDIPEQIYEHFISDFGHKINLLKLAHFAVHVSKHLPSKERALAFLQQVQAKLREQKLPRSAEPLLFLQMHVGQAQLELGALQDAKATIEQGHDELASLSSVDPSVSAAVFYVKSLLHKLKKEYTEFYRSSLMYLSFVSSDALAYDFKLALAVDVSLAALLGENLYNFAQLLMHPIVHVLDASPYQWLHEMLECFNKGDLFKYDELCAKHAALLNAQPALVESERMLRQKVTISCLINLISALQPEERTIPLQVRRRPRGRAGRAGLRRWPHWAAARSAGCRTQGRRRTPRSRQLSAQPGRAAAHGPAPCTAASPRLAASPRTRARAPTPPAPPAFARRAGHRGAHQADCGRRGVPADEGAGAAPDRGAHRPGGGQRAGGLRGCAGPAARTAARGAQLRSSSRAHMRGLPDGLPACVGDACQPAGPGRRCRRARAGRGPLLAALSWQPSTSLTRAPPHPAPQVTWVQPQVLTKPRIQGLKDRLDSWLSKVSSVSSTLEQETIGVVEVA
jgi:26S proteasome regulatory subunit N9